MTQDVNVVVVSTSDWLRTIEAQGIKMTISSYSGTDSATQVLTGTSTQRLFSSAPPRLRSEVMNRLEHTLIAHVDVWAELSKH